MKKFVTMLIVVALALSALGCATAGDVEPIGISATMKGLQSVVDGVPGTFIMQGKNLILMAWPNADKYNFVVLGKNTYQPVHDFVKIAGGNGNQVGMLSMADLVAGLKQQGWSYIRPVDLPDPIILGVQSASAWLGLIGTSIMPTILVLPAGVLTPPDGVVNERS